jgi:hypothetical protein
MFTPHIAGYVGTFRTSRIITPDCRAGIREELSFLPSQEKGVDREKLDHIYTAKDFL